MMGTLVLVLLILVVEVVRAAEGGVPCSSSNIGAPCTCSHTCATDSCLPMFLAPGYNQVEFNNDSVALCAAEPCTDLADCCAFPLCHGDRGTFGTYGTSGTSGTVGSSGGVGSGGQDGTSGAPGPFGTGGSAGSAGTAGTSGTAGLTAGAPGTAGLMQERGTDGTSGAAGTSTAGTSGSAGTGGQAGTSGLEGSYATAGFDGVGGTAGSAGFATAGSYGTAGSAGTAVYTAGTTGTIAGEGSTGSAGTSMTGTSGTAGTFGTTGTKGTAGTIGNAGTNGLVGVSGVVGALGGICRDDQTLTLSTLTEIVPQSSTFTVNVDVTNELANAVTVKLIIDSVVLPAVTALTITPSNVTCTSLTQLNTFLCSVPEGVSSFAFPLNTSAAEGFAKISATVSNFADHDCAFDTQTIQVGYDFNSGRCGCAVQGQITFPSSGGCVAVCNANRKRSVSGIVRTSYALVPGVRARSHVSVTFRRVQQNHPRMDSVDTSVSRCGPLLSLLVNSKVVWSNSLQVEFNSEGVVSGSAEFVVPFDSPLTFVLDMKMRNCRGFSVSVWDPSFFVETTSGLILVSSDSPNPAL
jgi:hypothetical protein